MGGKSTIAFDLCLNVINNRSQLKPAFGPTATDKTVANHQAQKRELKVNPDKTIRIAAAIIMDEQDRMLLVRKRGTPFFMQPGGKIESTESSVTALMRELSEELQIHIAKEDTHFVGQLTDVAANEPGCTLIAEIFLVRAYAGPLAPAAEIEEIEWYHPAKDTPLMLAPLTGKQIIPLMLEGVTRPA